MSELTVHIASIAQEPNHAKRAWGIAERYSFELRWEAVQDTASATWQIVIPAGQTEADEPLFELVTGEDMKAFSRVVNLELQRTQMR